VWNLFNKVLFNAATKIEKEEFEEEEIKFDVIYWGVDFSTELRRNYHFFIFIRNAVLPIFVGN
jgi:hypothetical protein